MSVARRIRVGVAEFSDGWNVVIDFHGQQQVYDPAYPTEAEALAKAEEVARLTREVARNMSAL